MSEMRRLVLGLPDQLRRAGGLDPPRVPAAERALVAGMGGSGISGDFAARLAEETGRLAAVHKGYGLPGWAEREGPLVVLVSYSGDTEETLSAARAAHRAGLPVAVVSSGGRLAEMAAERGWAHLPVPGGLQPRAALGHLAGAVVRVLESAGVLPPQGVALAEAASVLEDLMGGGDGPAVSLAEDLAEGLAGRMAVVYGAEATAPPAQRWKTQINENAEAPAFWSVLPELDHNEVVGWCGPLGLTRGVVGLVLLRDERHHPRIRLRFDLTAELVGDRAPVVGEVWAQGDGTLARMMSLVAVGDLVSVSMAERAGVDPMPVEAIDRLKLGLSEAESLPASGD